MNNLPSKISINDIKEIVFQSWNNQNGCNFVLNGWEFKVYSHNKLDVWGRKLGTEGKTRKTFCRFSINQ